MELVDTSALILALRDEAVGRWLRDAVVANDIVICDQVASSTYEERETRESTTGLTPVSVHSRPSRSNQ